ncbi:hypothetical protein VP191E371_P0046 [Vibrio phage 191E37-1]|nr:hypothetical protein VP191E371_P0046 [Vibrio phage 191E37-1]CAH9013629.1 hypothetical protein VP455E521_P0049 [Vibrio phage 455E52-1]CAH9016641.1 hypothetical protein VP217E381_P0048 [Vibrio phage 217E38-1]
MEKCHIGNLTCWLIVIGAVSPVLVLIMLKVVQIWQG